tara:strand:+ start:146 stop:706 length:561 start_codon:yes stop_codon:yes gene_type:complete
VILLKHILSELTSDEAYGILLGVFDNMPDYVFNDFVMSDRGFFQKELNKILRKDPDADEEDIAYQFRDWVDIKWKKQILEVNASDFTKKNIRSMMSRKFGDANPGKVPDEERRVKLQRKFAREIPQGKNEPVIVLDNGRELKLVEGWHRTMAILSLGNNGEADPTKWNKVKLKAWVGTGPSVKKVW